MTMAKQKTEQAQPQEKTPRDKAYLVLSSVGQTRHIANSMNDEETAALAAIFDKCVDHDDLLAGEMDAFWAARETRLAEQKATDDVQPTPTA